MYNIFEYDDYFQRCPLLKPLTYTAYHLDVEEAAAFAVGYDDITMDDDFDVRKIKIDLTTIRPQPIIESFTGSFIFVLYSDETIKYFMHKFPNLKYLNLNTKCDKEMLNNDVDEVVSHSPSTMIDFFKYSRNILVFNCVNLTVSAEEDEEEEDYLDAHELMVMTDRLLELEGEYYNQEFEYLSDSEMNNEGYEYEYPSFYHEFDDEEDEHPA